MHAKFRPPPAHPPTVDGEVEQARLSVEEEFRDFAYIVSHDLAGSLRHVTEFSRLLLEEVGDDLTDQQRLFGEHIRSAGERCRQMTEQLLVYSRVQQKPLEPAWQDAFTTVQIALLNISASARTTGAELHVDPLGEIYADPKLLGLALRHLLDNAIKFTGRESRRRIEVRAARDRAACRIQIRDNGIGVEPAFRETAFRMFQRLHPDDGWPGVGAGLPICRRIARRHGGEVRFLDQEEGACVELTLPKPPA